VPAFTLSENVILSRHADAGMIRHRMIDRGLARAIAERVCTAFDVRRGKPDPEARALSGGNLQKFVIGREMDRSPAVLVVNQPTWGVDAGAAALIRQALVDMARGGAAVLVISQDLDEIFEIADRIAVISRGELSEAYPAASLDTERIGLLMAGAHERGHTASAGPEAHAAHA
jgi:simple sugar transport system ATP-binding protein